MFKIKGLKQMQRELDKLADNLKSLVGVPLGELFPPQFMQANSRFATIEEMLAAKELRDPEAFERMADEEWSQFVVETTNFTSWEEMKEAGAEEWAATRPSL